MKSLLRTAVLATSLLGFAGAGWTAEGKATRVSEHGDWAVFVDKSPKECWSVSLPKKSVNTRGGRTVSVKRSDILLFVSYIPGSGIKGQISFTGGYPFDDGSNVDVNIDGTRYQMFTNGEWAWAPTDEADKKMVQAMKRGAKATLTGRSSRGTKTEDTFSIKGFTAAVEDASKRCK